MCVFVCVCMKVRLDEAPYTIAIHNQYFILLARWKRRGEGINVLTL